MLVSLTSIPGKAMEQFILETISMHMREKKINRSSQNRLTKGKSHLTNMISFYNDTTSQTDGREIIVPKTPSWRCC